MYACELRFFLIDRERNGDELREVFKVLGSTGNVCIFNGFIPVDPADNMFIFKVYEVVIDKVPGCSCPDALKGNHCKHLLFVFLKGELVFFPGQLLLKAIIFQSS